MLLMGASLLTQRLWARRPHPAPGANGSALPTHTLYRVYGQPAPSSFSSASSAPSRRPIIFVE